MSDRKPHQRHSEALQALDIGALVPPAYARYRPLISEALRFFLASLPAPRLMELLQAQLALPADSTPLERLLALIHRSPTLHKLGQTLARDPKLAPSLRTALQQLESLPPTTPMSALHPVIESELGDCLGLALDGPPLAEASVAVVVPCRWHEPNTGRQIKAVLKVLKPGIEARLREELDVLPDLGNWLETRCAELSLPPVQYRETLASVRGLLLNEVELRHEQEHLTAAARHYANLPQVKIPELLPFSTARITAMERIDGCKVTDADHLSAAARRRLAATAIEALLARPFWSDGPLATFHADPHAGNLFVTGDGRLALLDWSLVTSLDKSQREALVDLGLGALTLDEGRIRRTIARLVAVTLEPTALQDAVAEAIRQVRRGAFPGLSWLTALLDRLAISAGAVYPESLTLFRKSLFTLTHVLNDLAPGYSMDSILIQSGIAQLGREIISRMARHPLSREFGTHASNLDLLSLWAGAPWVATRYWMGHWEDAVTLSK